MPDRDKAKIRQDIEDELLAEVQVSRSEFENSVDGDRTEARERFANALSRFNGFILYGKSPNR